ncbi:MAG: tetratricopeptide repeat protein [Bacteroidota bacterium]
MPFNYISLTKSILLTSMLICFLSEAFAQHPLADTVINRRQKALDIQSDDPEKALKMLKETLELTRDRGYKSGEYFTLEGLGYFHFSQNEMQEAIEAYQESVNLSVEMDSLMLKAYGLQHLSNVYLRLGRLDKAESLIVEASEIFKAENYVFEQARTIGTLGSIAMQSKDYEKGLENYFKARKLFENIGKEDEVARSNLNISYIYLMQGKGEMALPYINKSLNYHKALNEVRSIAMCHGNLGYAYHLMGEYEKAFDNYQACVDSALKYNWKRIVYDTYKDMSDTYLKSGQPAEALDYFKKYHFLRDSVIGEQTQARIADLEIKFETELKERKILELQQEKRIQQLQLWILGGGLAVLALLAILIFSKMRDKIRRKQEQINSTKEELAFKTNRLTDFALDIVQKNQFSNDMMTSLDSIDHTKIPKSASDKLRQLRLSIISHLRINEGLDAFQQNVNEIHFDFNHRLNKRFPDLSVKDVILCGLLRLNLQNKEIATIRGVSDNAVKMARYRLRKKLGLNEEDEIVRFLNKI